LGAVIFWVFGTRSQLQYPMIVALLCFALSTVACLLFASQAKLNATLPIASITMGGPAVIWIGTLILFAYLFPVPPVSQQSIVDILRMQQIREGWRDDVRRDSSAERLAVSRVPVSVDRRDSRGLQAARHSLDGKRRYRRRTTVRMVRSA
jgi:hypothetical protein